MHRLIQLIILLLITTSCGTFDIREAPQVSDHLVPPFQPSNRVYVVTSLEDSGPGTLRELVATVPAESIIEFKENLAGTITLTSAPITIDRELRIIGPTIDGLTIPAIIISGSHARRVFQIAGNGDVLLQNLIIERGQADNGGGILVQPGGSLNLRNTEVRNNQATGNGGGIFLDENSALSLLESTISNNRAGQGGGLFAAISTLNHIASSTFSDNFTEGQASAISMHGQLTMTNSTLAKNTSESFVNGAALLIDSAADVTIAFSTITDNTAINQAFSGFTYFAAASLALKANIIAQNWTLNPQQIRVDGIDFIATTVLTVNSLGYNIIGIANSAYGFWTNSDLHGAIQNPKRADLSPLANNGGPTQTCRMQVGSPAHDQVPIADCYDLFPIFPLRFDQRGFARPGAGNQTWCDIGAYELE